MELDKIIELIQAVSDSSLTDFKMEEGNLKLSMKTDKGDRGMPAAVEASGIQIPVLAADTAAETAPASGHVVKAPLVGTYYAAASPDADPFVQVGDTVKKGQILGIIEAMKLMNEIESEYDGTVKEILVENEDIIEFGQPMFVIV